MNKISCLVLFALVVLCGCKQEKTVQLVQPKPAAPCAPNVAQEMEVKTGLVPATIETRAQTNVNWSATHRANCPENMRTVLPSIRETDRLDPNADFDKWYAEHTLCEPDGLKDGQR